MSSKNSRKSNNMIIAFITLLAVIALVALAGFFLLRPAPEIIQGQAEADEVRISSKVPGRIESYRVEEGQRVSKGDTLGFLFIPDVKAKLAQAQAAEAAAAAQNQKAIKGARAEQIAAAYQMWQKAKAGREIAEASYRRVQNLFDKGVVPAQKRDEALANYKAMVATEQAAQSQYTMAKNGAEKEDKMAAEALVERAKGAIAEVNSYVEESILISPIDGEVSEIFPKVGELVGTGAPILNVMDIDDVWVSFNVREDLLEGLRMGEEFDAVIPALNDLPVTMKVTYLKNLGSYAAWKATKTTGGYDIQTFEVRAKPTVPVEGLRPGMTVLIKK